MRLLSLAAVALALAACSDDGLARAEIPVGATFVSQVISRDLAESRIPDSSTVTLTFDADTVLRASVPPNGCLFGIERAGPATWTVRESGACTLLPAGTALAEEILGILAGGTLALADGTVTARQGRHAVIFE